MPEIRCPPPHTHNLPACTPTAIPTVSFFLTSCPHFPRTFLPHSLQVEYPPRPGSEDWYYVQYAVSDLHELQPAWCMTVHKSQGAEYPCVLVALHHEAGGAERIKDVVRIGAYGAVGARVVVAGVHCPPAPCARIRLSMPPGPFHRSSCTGAAPHNRQVRTKLLCVSMLKRMPP